MIPETHQIAFRVFDKRDNKLYDWQQVIRKSVDLTPPDGEKFSVSMFVFAALRPDDFVVQQFTGIFDMDEKPIFEGDKVMLFNHTREEKLIFQDDGVRMMTINGPARPEKLIDIPKGTALVGYMEPRAGFYLYFGGGITEPLSALAYTYKVLGNRFENPELFEELANAAPI